MKFFITTIAIANRLVVGAFCLAGWQLIFGISFWLSNVAEISIALAVLTFLVGLVGLVWLIGCGVASLCGPLKTMWDEE